jgi:hypothetical protein
MSDAEIAEFKAAQVEFATQLAADLGMIDAEIEALKKANRDTSGAEINGRT